MFRQDCIYLLKNLIKQQPGKMIKINIIGVHFSLGRTFKFDISLPTLVGEKYFDAIHQMKVC